MPSTHCLYTTGEKCVSGTRAHAQRAPVRVWSGDLPASRLQVLCPQQRTFPPPQSWQRLLLKSTGVKQLASRCMGESVQAEAMIECVQQ